MARLRLKTKLVLAISAMVVALVSVLSYVYVAQLMRQRMLETYTDADFVAKELINAARDALAVDLSSTKIDLNNPQEVREAIEDSLQSDPGLTSLLQSIVGYSPTIYDAAIVDTSGRALLHTDAGLQDTVVPARENFAHIRDGNFRQQLEIVYGAPRVYEIRIPIRRGDEPFGDVRVGISTVFLKNELQPQLNRALGFSTLAIFVSLILAAALSNFALRPMEAIARRLDRMTAGEIETLPEKEVERGDEYGVVTTKIDRLGRQMRSQNELFTQLKGNLDQLMANLQDGLMLFTRDWRVVLVSALAERFAGKPRAEILGHSVEEIFSEDNPLGRLVLDAFHTHRAFTQREIETGTGQRVNVSLDFIEQDGERIGALLNMRDVESVRRIEDEIEVARRLSAIGRLTSGVAHEVKNPINAIVLHLEVLREKLQQADPAARRHMDVIGNEIQRLDRVVGTLVDFTRPVELRLADVDLRRTVDEVTMLAAPQASKHNVTIARDEAPVSLPVKVDADLVKQALLNIVINGIQAMPEGGTLAIAATRENDEVQVEIRDQGPGIPAEIQDKVFNLYFTTKKSGSGIGLAMTYRVMQLHNGSVQFESAAGKGTTFRLRFPALTSGEDALQEIAART